MLARTRRHVTVHYGAERFSTDGRFGDKPLWDAPARTSHGPAQSLVGQANWEQPRTHPATSGRSGQFLVQPNSRAFIQYRIY